MCGVEARLFGEALVDGAVREDVEAGLMEFGRNIGTGRPSLAQDVLKGRKTEVEYLNGLVVRRGAEVRVPTPVNQAVVDLTARVEAGELDPSVSNVGLIE
jgi:2-dehydropantoate 2-reductase